MAIDAKKVAAWIAGIGLATAIVTFGTSMMGMVSSLKAAQAKSEQQIGLLRSSLEAETAKNQRLTKELERQVEEQRAQTAAIEFQTVQMTAQNDRCSQHTNTLNRLEGSFADLRARNGTMLSMFKSCSNSSDSGSCAMTVCVGAMMLGGDCIGTLNNASQLSSTIKSTRAAAYQDGCQVPSSPALTFLQ